MNYIALLGWCPKDNREIFTLDELVQHFSIVGVSKSPAIFDYEKLLWLNGEYLRAMTPEEFTRRAMPYYREVLPTGDYPWDVLTSILQPRVGRLTEIPEMIEFFHELPEYPVELFTNKKSKTTPEVSIDMLNAAIPVLEALPEWTLSAIHDSIMELVPQLEVKNGTLLWPVRIAAAGHAVTPGGAFEILCILGKEESLKRLKLGLEKLGA